MWGGEHDFPARLSSSGEAEDQTNVRRTNRRKGPSLRPVCLQGSQRCGRPAGGV